MRKFLQMFCRHQWRPTKLQALIPGVSVECVKCGKIDQHYPAPVSPQASARLRERSIQKTNSSGAVVSQPNHNRITVTVSGQIGSGKSAILGEIEIALKAIGLPVQYADYRAARQERYMTGADWTSYLEMYKPCVILVESRERKS